MTNASLSSTRMRGSTPPSIDSRFHGNERVTVMLSLDTCKLIHMVWITEKYRSDERIFCTHMTRKKFYGILEVGSTRTCMYILRRALARSLAPFTGLRYEGGDSRGHFFSHTTIHWLPDGSSGNDHLSHLLRTTKLAPSSAKKLFLSVRRRDRAH